jgi:hypothetical protein
MSAESTLDSKAHSRGGTPKALGDDVCRSMACPDICCSQPRGGLERSRVHWGPVQICNKEPYSRTYVLCTT